MINPNQSRSVLDTIRSIQQSVERIAKQTGTEHLFGNVGYVLELDEKAKDKAKEEAKKTTPANESQVVDAPNSVSVPKSKRVNYIAYLEHLFRLDSQLASYKI